jgi:hypothetical protein
MVWMFSSAALPPIAAMVLFMIDLIVPLPELSTFWKTSLGIEIANALETKLKDIKWKKDIVDMVLLWSSLISHLRMAPGHLYTAGC